VQHTGRRQRGEAPAAPRRADQDPPQALDDEAALARRVWARAPPRATWDFRTVLARLRVSDARGGRVGQYPNSYTLGRLVRAAPRWRGRYSVIVKQAKNGEGQAPHHPGVPECTILQRFLKQFDPHDNLHTPNHDL